MNGAESLITSLLNNSVEVCFCNPGTSEMHFVGALHETEGIGVSASRATTAEEFNAQLEHAFNKRRPHLIDALIPALF